ncbi:hypothetical protein CDAR_434521 [Caerostris darwini]|uniref:Uncharacterized protein n=1 Tax=Caerostris darwini TaxID=1538125 RepID=A0AAV4PKV2_9ARAC|nr:hypothetical protein CDAR_434521 [Caerostris darwini]
MRKIVYGKKSNSLTLYLQYSNRIYQNKKICRLPVVPPLYAVLFTRCFLERSGFHDTSQKFIIFSIKIKYRTKINSKCPTRERLRTFFLHASHTLLKAGLLLEFQPESLLGLGGAADQEIAQVVMGGTQSRTYPLIGGRNPYQATVGLQRIGREILKDIIWIGR